MTTNEIIQIITGCIGSLCFGILFNMHGKKLIAAAIGGLISWGMFAALSMVISNETINYFLVSIVISLYAEIIARIQKTPVTPIVTTALIPLIPGGSLYYTMAYAFERNLDMFIDKAVYTLKLACALALGILIVTAVFGIIFKTPKDNRAKKKTA